MPKPIHEKDVLEDSERIAFADFLVVNSKDLSVVLTKMLKLNGNPYFKKKLFSIETSPNISSPIVICIAANAPVLFERVYRKRIHRIIEMTTMDEGDDKDHSFAEHKIPLGMWQDKKYKAKNDRKVKKVYRRILI